ncbi:MAG: hypothetical protein Q7R81_06720 [Candidatus Peregrinibacteria bacterium]|nr:hypothetical protein [Candidatus Peregrinibacteria bacterium]
MTQKSLIRALVITTSLLWPLGVSAAVGSVTGIQAEAKNGGIEVKWNPVPGATIAEYRVYYSQASILQNNGAYDEFEVVPVGKTDFVLTSFPQVPTLYVSVLAFDRQGDSSRFTEEAKVTLREGGAASSAQTSTQASTAASSRTTVTSSAPATEATFHLLSATAISATGVTLAFSQNVTIPQAEAKNAFTIQDASGTFLTLKRLVIQGSSVTIHTEPQKPGAVYELNVSQVVQAADGAPRPGGVFSTLFSAYSGAQPSSSSTSQPPSPGSPADVTDLRLRATAQRSGRYSVTAQWQPATTSGLTAYVVRQSFDRGTTFGDPQAIAAETTTVQFEEVPAGEFGIAVQAVNQNGLASRGIFSSITLPAVGAQQPVKKPDMPLSSSGPAALLAFVAAGGIAGWRKVRKGK